MKFLKKLEVFLHQDVGLEYKPNPLRFLYSGETPEPPPIDDDEHWWKVKVIHRNTKNKIKYKEIEFFDTRQEAFDYIERHQLTLVPSDDLIKRGIEYYDIDRVRKFDINN